ncbi:hypothetical protein PG2T_03820 [Immundisolibacter cernigliae]|uniref:DNA-binding protein n=1 Tax=Immundisolibacter cernigliae TaxID=1810504 RepID=A0A1B1YRJ6_9GAMM|nr:hypothetical protein PG2T_03820 [Immundisolibacter cernigliae]
MIHAVEVHRPHGPVPMGRTAFNEAVRRGEAPQPVQRRHRSTLYRWGDIREFLEKLATGENA